MRDVREKQKNISPENTIRRVMSTQEEILEEVLTETTVKKENEIVVYNDDVNTFDHVIECLMYACDHDPIQAEQCTILIHYKGKCGVKSGAYEELEPSCSKLLEAGLSAEIV